MAKEKMIKARIFRYNRHTDKKPRYETYEVPIVEGSMSVLNVLQYIYENIDPSLSFIASCRLGLCGRCDMIVNGKPVQGCAEVVDGDITVEPALKLGLKPLKDIIANDQLTDDSDLYALTRGSTTVRLKKAYDRSSTQKKGGGSLHECES